MVMGNYFVDNWLCMPRRAGWAVILFAEQAATGVGIQDNS